MDDCSEVLQPSYGYGCATPVIHGQNPEKLDCMAGDPQLAVTARFLCHYVLMCYGPVA